MLTLNKKVVLNTNYFPDGTMHLDGASFFKNDSFLSGERTNRFVIKWNFENNEELIALMFYVQHIRANCFDAEIHLEMPYIPNARQDRVKSRNDIFTLKYFANIINSMNFATVTVLDPHSNVSNALFNNLIVRTPESYIHTVVSNLQYDLNRKGLDTNKFSFFFPDEGAMKRYSELVKNMPIIKDIPFTFGMKNRDWKTGVIKGLEVCGDTNSFVKDNHILIVDDICSKGGTFYFSAKKLKELGAASVHLFVSHCEDSIFDGELLKENDLIDTITTTNSIFNKKHEKIHILNV